MRAVALFIVGLVASALPARAAGPDTFTPNFFLVMPGTGTTGWGIKLNVDISSIDVILGQISNSTQNIAGLVARSTSPFTFVSSTTFLAPALFSGTSIFMTGPNGYIVTGSSVNASSFWGDGFHITGINAANVTLGTLPAFVFNGSTYSAAIAAAAEQPFYVGPKTIGSSVTVNAANPSFSFFNQTGGTDSKIWKALVSASNDLDYLAMNDAGSSGSYWMRVFRNGVNVSTVVFPNGVVQVGGGPSANPATFLVTGTSFLNGQTTVGGSLTVSSLTATQTGANASIETSSGVKINSYGLILPDGTVLKSTAGIVSGPGASQWNNNLLNIWFASTTAGLGPNVGIGVASPTVSLQISSRTDGIGLPNGTDAQRPSNPPIGTFRYNTTGGQIEVWNGALWAGSSTTIVGAAGQVGIVNSTTTAGIPSFATASTVLTGVSGSSVSLTLSNADHVRLTITAAVSNSGTNDDYMSVFEDGVNLSGTNGQALWKVNSQANNTAGSFSWYSPTVRPAGTHTYAIAIAAGGGTVTFNYVAGAGGVTNSFTAEDVVGFGTAYLSSAAFCGASGGSLAVVNGQCVHTFTSSGTLVGFNGNVTVQLNAGGGGGGMGGSGGGGGGGGGGVIPPSTFVLTASTYSVKIGSGGAPGIGIASPAEAHGKNGGDTTFDSLDAVGGGGGGNSNFSSAGNPGGSGGGDGASGGSVAGTVGQGNAGGIGQLSNGAGGGGGAGAVGGNRVGNVGGAGGNGIPTSISGVLTYYGAGGGAGAPSGGTGGVGGLGGGGTGAALATPTNGTNGLGGGGGGTGNSAGAAGFGGDGSFILSYPAGYIAYPVFGLMTTSNTTVQVTGNGFTVGGSTFVVTEGKVAIGTNTTSVPFEVQSDSAITTFMTRFANDSRGASVIGRRARGTAASPLALNLNDNIYAVGGRPFDGTGFTSTSTAVILFTADENLSTGHQGTRITFEVTPNGNVNSNRIEAVRINSTGTVGIGITNPDAKALLHVNGNEIIKSSLSIISGGLVFADGSTMTGVAFTSSTFGMGTPAAAQTAFGVCTTSLTVTNNRVGNVDIIFSGSGTTTGTNATIGLNVLRNGAFLAGFSSTVGMSAASVTNSVGAATIIQDLSFDITVPLSGNAADTFCLTSKTSAGNFSFNTANVQNQFKIRTGVGL